MWFIENRPDIYEQAWKFCCVQDYVVFKLTGEGRFIDYSMAGRTMITTAILIRAPLESSVQIEPIISTLE